MTSFTLLLRSLLLLSDEFEQVKNSIRRSSVTYGTPCHVTGHFVFCYHEFCGFGRAFCTLSRFLLYTPSCSFQGFPGSRQFNVKVSRTSCWPSKHNPGPAICLNHNNPKRGIVVGSVYGLQLAAYVKNLLLTRFEPFSRPVRYVENHMAYPFSHRAIPSEIN